jgi:long-chain acyl-CoA synthetase
MLEVVCSAMSRSFRRETSPPPYPIASATVRLREDTPRAATKGDRPVREFATPSTYQAPATGNLTDDVVSNATHHPDSVVFSVREAVQGRQAWREVTAAEFRDQVTAVAKGLVAAGLEPGGRVALMSRTRYEWTLLDYAIWFAGGVSVPLYETSTVDQVSWVLSDSGASVAVVETAEHRKRIEQSEANGSVGQVWCLDEGAVEELASLGGDCPDEVLAERRTQLRPDTLATMVYTSGTTGRPKGCMLTHGHFMFELAVAVQGLDELFDDQSSTLLFLPLAHIFARVVQIGAVRTRTRLGHSADVAHLVRDLQAFEPTFVLGVPRIFEKVFNTASQEALAEGRGRWFGRAVEVAIAHSRASEEGRPGLLLRGRHRFFDRLVYARLRQSLGGRCRYAVSGAAPLGERLGHFYRGIGVTILEGYGLTETTAAVTLNLPDAIKIGTVGRPLGGTTVRVAEDGELQVHGGQVFAGYWGNDEATSDVLTADGWLATGDLGEIDDEGFVRVTGRKRELLVTVGGKTVAPSLLEDAVRAHPLVSQCLVVGDGRPFIGALITLDPDAVAGWVRTSGRTGGVADLVDDEALRSEIQECVDAANRAVSQAESIRRFTVLPLDWTEEGGQLTPSLKLRRNVVTRQFRREIEDLYAR